jgi:hypothetical protein
MRRLGLVAAAAVLGGCGWHGLALAPVLPTPEPTPATTVVAEAPASEAPLASPPPSSVIEWKPNPIRRTSTGVSLFSGTVVNTDAQWSIKNVQVELKLVDANGNVRETLYGKIQDLRPGDKGDYTIAVPADLKFDLSNLRLMWKWELI